MFKKLLLLPALALSLLLLPSCAEETSEAEPEARETSFSGPYALRAFIKSKSGTREQLFSPPRSRATTPEELRALFVLSGAQGEGAATLESQDAALSSFFGVDLPNYDLPDFSDFSDSFPLAKYSGEIELNERSETATLLLKGAASSCLAEAGGKGPSLASSEVPLWGPIPKGTGNMTLSDVNDTTEFAWYVFDKSDMPWSMSYGLGGPFSTCDELLLAEQTLLCMADKLAELADTTKPVTWEVNNLGWMTGTWIFPMQHPRDKFIARDLALNALAHLGRLDFERPQAFRILQYSHVLPEATCASSYAAVLADPKKAIDGSRDMLFATVPCASNKSNDCVPKTDELRLPPVKSGETELTEANAKQLALGRLEFNAQVLSTGAALVKELVEASVCDDLAGAYAKRAEAQDPERANALYWGAVEEEDGPYNSAAHALRVLFGRLEQPLSRNWKDDKLQGVTLLHWLAAFGTESAPGAAVTTLAPAGDWPWNGFDALYAVQQGALGEGTAARWEEREVVTRSQEEATRLLRSTGLVLSPKLLAPASGVSLAKVRAAVKQQLQYDLARAHSRVSSTPFDPTDSAFTAQQVSNPLELQPGGQLGLALDAISDEDLRFALERVAGAYRQFADVGEDLGASQALQLADAKAVEKFGGVTIPRVAPLFAQLDGQGAKAFVVEQGLSGSKPGDGYARAAGVQMAAQHPNFDTRTWGGTSSGQRIDSATAYESADFGMQAAFQDVFMLGDTLRRRLHHLQQLLVQSSEADAKTLARDLELRSAAIRAWAGPGRVRVLAERAKPEWLDVRLTGLSPEDLGVVRPENMAGTLAFVWGRPWVADCATGHRTDCPKDFQTDYVQRAQPLATTQMNVSAATVVPYHGYRLDLRLFLKGDALDPVEAGDKDGRPRMAKLFTPVRVASSFDHQNNALYLVRVGRGGQRGEVLAALALPAFVSNAQQTMVTEAALSAMQQKLARQVLNISDDWVEPRVGGSSSATSVSYCIRGPSCVFGESKDLFVPLENDLTTNSNEIEDSWRHYLERARQASVQADTLGKELIQLKLEQFERMEGAQEAVGAICGDYGAMGDVTVGADGKTSVNGNQTLQTCLNEEKYDLAFLTADQLKEIEPGKAAAEQKKLLNCDDPDAARRFDKELCEKASAGKLSHTGLSNIQPLETPAAADRAAYQALVPAAAAGNLNALPGLANTAFVAPESFQAALRPAKFKVDNEGEWTLTWGNELVMSTAPVRSNDVDPDSADKQPWPACALLDVGGTSGKLHCTHPTAAWFANGMFEDDGSQSDTVRKARWRFQVEGMLWTMGALGGSMPANVLDVPLPVWNWAGHDGGVAAPIAMVFPSGEYGLATDNPVTYELSSNEADIAALGRALPLHSSLRAGLTQSGLWPTWQTTALSNAASDTNVLVVRAQNAERSYTETVAHQMGVSSYLRALGGSGCGTEVETQLQHWGDALCPMLRGAPANSYLKNVLTSADQQNIHAMDSFDVPHCGIRGGDGRGYEVIHTYSGDGCVEAKANGTLPEWLLNRVDGEGRAGVHAVSEHSTWVTQAQAVCSRGFEGPGVWSGFLQATDVVLGPRACSAHQRVDVFTNQSFISTDPCDGEKDLARAMAMTCFAGPGGPLFVSMLSGSEPPPVNSIEDLALVGAWLDVQSHSLHERTKSLWLRGVPKRAAADYDAKNAGSGPQAGKYGVVALELGQHLSQLGVLLESIRGDLQSVKGIVRTTQLELEGANLQHELEVQKVTVQIIQAELAIVQASLGVIGGVIGGLTSGAGIRVLANTATGAAQSAAAIVEQGRIVDTLNDQKDTLDKIKNNNVMQILSRMTEGLQGAHGLMETHIGELRKSALGANSAATQLESLASEATYQLAKGSGADYVVKVGQGLITFPVNRATNRLFSATRLRYQQALDHAKHMAQLARLSIEQRLGVKLNLMKEPLGSLPAPADWADRVCTMAGVDALQIFGIEGESSDQDVLFGDVKARYEDDGVLDAEEQAELKTIEQSVIESFAENGYVGDYVEQLALLVDYYNVEYPAQAGDDVMVLSLRDDLLENAGVCSRTLANEFLYSDDLTQPGDASHSGWKRRPTERGDELYLAVDSLEQLERKLIVDGKLPEAERTVPPLGMGRGTWLHDVKAEALGIDGDEQWSGEGDPASSRPEDWAPPGRGVRQQVTLAPGRYLLSWWDQARDGNGNLADSTSLEGPLQEEPYVVTVYDSEGTIVNAWTGAPELPLLKLGGSKIDPKNRSAELWSPRRTLSFDAEEAGLYTVAIRPSVNGAVAASLAIANLQLEESADLVEPRPYEATSGTRLALTTDCIASSAESFRAAFDYRCERLGCFYELKLPWHLDTQVASTQPGPLTGQLAIGNRNFRHVSTATNVVGYGVLDCSRTPTPQCYSTGYVEYDLEHEAFDVPVLGMGEPVRFDFGMGQILRGKAIAAERYVTLPIGSTDGGLLGQPEIEKHELRGRPLSGSYRLRVYESPALVWDAIEDVQLVVKYHYWSPVVTRR